MARRAGLPCLRLLAAFGPLLAQAPAGPAPAAPPAAAAAQARPQPRPPAKPDVQRLRLLVEAAERALEAEDEDAAFDRCEEAEVLVADWPGALLLTPEVSALVERLRAVQHEVDSEDEGGGADPAAPAAEVHPLLQEEVIALTGEELRLELERVKAAEEGSQYDFPIDLNDKVLTMVHTFTTAKRGFLEGSLSRAARYLPMVRQVFAEEGIPQDLAYLAVIESGYKNQAKSRAAAVGMWQFMRSTGRIFGLGGNGWIEERRDPVKATRAAARYLKRLHQISGDWYLALVGYNAGPLTVERAVQALDSRNFWDLYRSRYLRNETKNYVPSLCAAILVGKNPERFGLAVPPMTPYVFETVEVDRMTSLAVLARFAGTDVESLKDLNPELLRGTTPPGRYVLKVPPGTSGTVNRALSRIPSTERVDFKTYVLRRGDTPERVAARFRLSAEELLAANDLSRSQFRPGRRIQVPPPAPQAIDERDLLTREERARILGEQSLPALPTIPGPAGAAPAAADAAASPATAPSPSAASPSARPAPSPAPSPAPGRAPGVGRTTVATTGSTLASLARDFGVSLAELIRLNPELAKGLKPGDPVRLPDADAAAPAPVERGSARTHTVAKGETVFSIARRYGVTVAELRGWNGLRSNAIRRGQRLRVSAR